MPRPNKYTVDFFSHDADASEGRTLTILFNHYGHEGLSCWWLLLEKVSSTRNHVIDIRNSENFEYLAAKLHFTPDRLREILDKMSELEAIDTSLYKGGLIWIQNLVDRLDHVYKTRKQDLPSKPKLNGQENKLMLEETELILPVSTQRERERKEREKEIYKEKYGEFKNILLTLEEYKKLIERFGEKEAKEKIEILSSGIESKGYKYKSHYATILSWDRKDQRDNGTRRKDSTKLPTKYTEAPYDPELDG